MKIKQAVFWWAFLFLQVIGVASWVQAQSLPESPSRPEGTARAAIPREPGWRDPSYRGWELLSVPGLISTYYDLDGDGKLDYMVIRKIMRKASAEEITIDQAIQIARFDGMAVYFSHPAVYFTNKNPLFYCMGVDYRRNCQDIWVDLAEDGLNGNEELYTLSTPRLDVR